MNRPVYIYVVSCIAALCALILACKQPTPKCNIARGDFAATYTLVSGTGDCADLKGELLSVQAYNAKTSAHDDTPDYANTSIAIQAATISDLLAAAMGSVEPNAKDTAYSLGRFLHSEPTDHFCIAPELSQARLRLPEIPEQALDMCTTVPEQPQVDISYTWSNVRVYTTAANYGTQFTADLTYVKDGCTATYKVAAVYPAVSCNAAAMPEAPPDTPPDAGEDAAMMDAAVDPETLDAGSDSACPEPPETPAPIPDDSLCSAQADPEHGRAVGSGISPDVAVRCDPELVFCVLEQEPGASR